MYQRFWGQVKYDRELLYAIKGAFHLKSAMTTTTTAVFAVPLAYGRWVKSLVERILWLNSLCNMDAIKVIVLRCIKYESEDSSSSDDEWELVLRKRKKRTFRLRIPNYVDVVVRYMDYDFKSHFRLVNIHDFSLPLSTHASSSYAS